MSEERRDEGKKAYLELCAARDWVRKRRVTRLRHADALQIRCGLLDLPPYFLTFARTHITPKYGSAATSTITPAGNPTSRYVSA